MKRIVTFALSLAGSLALAGQLSAQATPDITSVPFRFSYSPGNLIVRGVSLGLVTSVKLNGNPLPIINTNPGGTQLVAGPLSPQEPGFDSIVTIANAGTSDSAPIEFVPSLKAVKRFNRMDLTIRGGGAGTYVIRASYFPRANGAIDAGIFNARWLSPSAAIILSGVFADSSAVTTANMLFPVQAGLFGTPLHLQGLCVVSGNSAYTNRTSLPGYGM